VSKHRVSGPRVLVITSALVSLFAISAGPVAADTGEPPGDASYTQNGDVARVWLGTCLPVDDDVVACTEAGLEIFAGKLSDSLSGVTHANQVCVTVNTYEYSTSTGEYSSEPSFEAGCAVDAAAGVIQFDAKLAGATLAPTTVALDAWVCDTSEPYECTPTASRAVTVAGTWTGIGQVIRSKSRSTFDDGLCRFNDSAKASQREATFTGSLGGIALDGSYDGSLLTGRFSYQSRCSEV
jgi:hypothetical protein